ncbi:MAG: acyl carrier protein [Gammaproteobacteria bacterium]|nr:acyl carrier protein [Gammaproteobacteria bacterium]
MSSLMERIKSIVAKQLKVEIDEIKDESSLEEDLGADSLDRVELVMAFEEEFQIEIVDEDAENITTVAEAHSYIKSVVGDE